MRNYLPLEQSQAIAYLVALRELKPRKSILYWREVFKELERKYVAQDRSKPPYCKIPVVVLKHLAKTTFGTDYCYLIYLCRRYKGGAARVNMHKLSKLCGVTRQKLQHTQTRLRKIGLIESLPALKVPVYGTKIRIIGWNDRTDN